MAFARNSHGSASYAFRHIFRLTHSSTVRLRKVEPNAALIVRESAALCLSARPDRRAVPISELIDRWPKFLHPSFRTTTDRGSGGSFRPFYKSPAVTLAAELFQSNGVNGRSFGFSNVLKGRWCRGIRIELSPAVFSGCDYFSY